MSSSRRARTAICLAAVWAASLPLAALPPAPPLAAAPPELRPGVNITFVSLATGARDSRHDRLAALAVPAGAPPSSLLPPGPFRAEFESNLDVPLRSDVTFSFAGKGAAELSVNGKVVLTEPGPELGGGKSGSVQLNKGANQLQVRFTASGGEAQFRLLWAGKDFAAEPLPPSALSADVSGIELRTAARVRAGRELFATLHCANCHEAGPPSDAGMPELAERAPSLAEAGARFRPEWIAAWILDPKAQRPDARMPRVNLEAVGDAADIAAFLGGLGSIPSSSGPASTALVTAGGRLFSELHCVACHVAPGSAAADMDPTRVSLSAVNAKWRPAALAEYLRDPRKRNESARMPDFRLTVDEAAQLAAFLLAGSAAPAMPVSGDASHGRKLFAQSCRFCHADPGTGFDGTAISAAKAPSLRALLDGDWTRGCLASAAPRGAAPDFGLDSAQRESLRAFAASGAGTLHQDSPVETESRAFNALRCIACHDRDGRPARYTSLAAEVHALDLRFAAVNRGEAEEQALDENPPPLTWTGEKLLSPWLERQIAGTLPERARPWLTLRMPGFGPRAVALARGLPLEHGEFPTGAEAGPEINPDLAELGSRLASPEYFSCITCHATGSTPAIAPFGAPGINFALVPGRLRYEYYLRWLDNPQRVDSAARMPRFTGENGKSLQTGILDGDAHAQWDAIHEYISQLAAAETPDRIQK